MVGGRFRGCQSPGHLKNLMDVGVVIFKGNPSLLCNIKVCGGKEVRLIKKAARRTVEQYVAILAGSERVGLLTKKKKNFFFFAR